MSDTPSVADIKDSIIKPRFFTAQRIFVLIIFVGAIAACRLLIGENSSVMVLPTVCFALFFLYSLYRDSVVTTGEDTIGFNTDAAVICGIAIIAAIANSPVSFVITLSVFIVYPANIMERKWSLLFFNFSNVTLAAIACFSILRTLNVQLDDSYTKLVPSILLASMTFEIINYSLLAVLYFLPKKKWSETKELLVDLRNNLVQTIPLAIICGIIGRYYLEVGAVALLGYVIPLIIGPEIYSSYARLMSSKKSSVRTLIYALEEKDPYTGGHVERVAMFARYIGEELNYKPFRQNRLYQAALLHDMGKLIVPSALLNKPGKLTDDEFARVKKHEGVTEEILSDISFLKAIAHTAGGDHNHMDTNAKIKYLEPYIVSVCDAFDAMTSSRSYRKALSQEIAFEELRNNSGKQFHGEVVEALIRAIEKRDEHYGAGYEENIIHEDAPEAGLGSAGLGDTIKGEENA